jgi:Macrocin-O-methyltransferase (TylF)
MSTLTRHLGITSAVRAARSLGVIVHKEQRSQANGYHYETVLLGKPLAPWLDQEFAALYDAAKDHTLVDPQRCYELWDLAKQVAHLIFPDDHLDEFCGKTFCLVHIDVDVYQSAKDVLAFVWPRLTVCGVVVFDDYGVATCNGITRVVDENKSTDRIVTYNLSGHAVMVKTRHHGTIH